MKWFKHDSDSSLDKKLQKVRLKYGMQGYGLYWYLLEMVAINVEKHNLSFELEHDAEIISFSTGISYELVQEMMSYMVSLGLFENQQGIITCLKMANRTDEYTQKLLRNSGVPTVSRQCPDKVPPNRREEKRIEETRIEEKRIEKTLVPSVRSKDDPDFDRWWKIYPKKRDKKKALAAWKRIKPDADLLVADTENRITADSLWVDGYIPNPTTYLNGERWHDEVETRRGSSRKLTYAEQLAADMKTQGLLK